MRRRVGAVAHAIGYDPSDQLLAAPTWRDRVKRQLVVDAATDNHRAPVEKAFGKGGPTPHQHTVPLETALARIELPPDRRVNAVATDQHVAQHTDAGAVRPHKAGFDGSFRLREGTEGVAGAERRPPQQLADRIAQHARHTVTGRGARPR